MNKKLPASKNGRQRKATQLKLFRIATAVVGLVWVVTMAIVAFDLAMFRDCVPGQFDMFCGKEQLFVSDWVLLVWAVFLTVFFPYIVLLTRRLGLKKTSNANKIRSEHE